MYKVMIVDDEPLAREVLKNIIKENFDNIHIVCEAVNGRQSIEFNREYKPDIILMDIRIPGINGIEASKQIAASSPEAVILIVTAYDDFNFVQQALDLGVKGYLLKPIKDEDVVDKINKCIKYIADNRNKGDLSKKMEETENIAVSLIRKKIVSKLMTGDFDKDEMVSYISFLQDRIEAGFFMLTAFEQDLSNHINDSIRNEFNMVKINEITSRFLPFTRKCYFGENIGNTHIVFFPIEKDYNEREIICEARTIAADIKRKIKVMAGIDIYAGIGRAYNGIDNMKQSYNEAYYALKKAQNSKEIIHFVDLKMQASSFNFQYPFFLENEMMEHMRSGDIEKAKKIACNIVSDVLNNCSSTGLAKEYLNQLISMLKRNIFLINADTEMMDSTEVISEINRITAKEELEIFCRNHIHSLLDSLIKFKQKSKDSVVVSMVTAYIDRYFSRDISLEKVAEEVGLRASYVSKIFKERIGVNFVDYILEKRINIAKEMMLEGEKNIKKISESVGYNDVNYFCRVFKKSTGLTTSQFRLQNSRIANKLLDK